MEFVDILERNLYLDTVADSLDIDGLADGFLVLIQVPYEAQNPLRFMEGQLLVPSVSLVTEHNGQLRIQIRCLVESVLDLGSGKSCGLLEDLRIRQEGDGRSRLLCLPDDREEPFFKLKVRLALPVPVMENLPFSLHLDIHPLREGIDNRGTDTVKAAGCLVGIAVELAAGMERREDHALRRDTLLVHADRNPSSVIADRAAAISVQRHIDSGAVPGQMLIDRVVDNLVDQMIQSAAGGTADIHARPPSDCLQPFDDLYGTCVVIFCHASIFLTIFPAALYMLCAGITPLTLFTG